MSLETLLAKARETRYLGKLPRLSVRFGHGNWGIHDAGNIVQKIVGYLSKVGEYSKRILPGKEAFTRRRVIAGAAILGAMLAVYGLKKAFSRETLDDYLPEGFEGIYLGMSYQDLQKIRSFAKVSESEPEQAYEELSKETRLQFFGYFQGENEAFPQYMLEHFNRRCSVLYNFTNNQLDKVDFQFSGVDCNSYYLVGDFKKGATARFGEETSFHKTVGNNKAIEWDKNKYLIGFYSLGDSYLCELHYVIVTKKDDKEERK